MRMASPRVASFGRRSPTSGRWYSLPRERGVHRAQLVAEVLGVIGLVGGERDRPRPVGARLDHVKRRDLLGVAVGLVQDRRRRRGRRGSPSKHGVILHLMGTPPRNTEFVFYADC
jgi:hypothetical protein